jgi:hypothetical protein
MSQVLDDVRRLGAVKVQLKESLIPVKVKYNTKGELAMTKAQFLLIKRAVDA